MALKKVDTQMEMGKSPRELWHFSFPEYESISRYVHNTVVIATFATSAGLMGLIRRVRVYVLV